MYEIQLYDRQIRCYTPHRFEIKTGDEWSNLSVNGRGINKHITFSVNMKFIKKVVHMLIHRVIYYIHNPRWNIYLTSVNNVVEHIIVSDEVDNSITNLRLKVVIPPNGGVRRNPSPLGQNNAEIAKTSTRVQHENSRLFKKNTHF